jgi:peptidoglycan/LPS O-acetylase OafA/YrhL
MTASPNTVARGSLPGSTSTPRIWGWDALRGQCALAVAAYHLLSWQDVAHWHTLGLYGVYLFFVLSGASLGYRYWGLAQTGRLLWAPFLLTRYVRLAPLYVLLCISRPWSHGNPTDTWAVAGDWLLNITFQFGWYQPVMHTLLIGGWSLGIEVVLYLLFPTLLWIRKQGFIYPLALAALFVLQLGWIQATVGAPGGMAAHSVLYHHAPAFAAYFAAGVMWGVAMANRTPRPGPDSPPIQRVQPIPRPLWSHHAIHHARRMLNRRRLPRGATVALAAVGFGWLVLGLANPGEQGDALLGWRGWLLPLVCVSMVIAASFWTPNPAQQRWVAWGSDASYGLYLIHPIVFFDLKGVAPAALLQWLPSLGGVPVAVLFAVAVIALSIGLALLSEYGFERAVRQRCKQWLHQ